MKNTPLRIFDSSVYRKWDFEKAARYVGNITNMISFMDEQGKPLTIEYMDENCNVIKTVKSKGDKKKALEYESKRNKFLQISAKMRMAKERK